METIIFYDTRNFERDFFEKELYDKFNLIFKEHSITENKELNNLEENAQIISVFTISEVNNEVLKRFKNLKLILTRSVGYNHIDIDYCNQKGIIVANTPHYGDYTVAEFSFGILLNIARKICIGEKELKQGETEIENFGIELYNKTIGIIGTGAIGSKSVKIAKGFSMNVICFDKIENKELIDKYNIKYTDLETLCKLSDIIMIHAPLTPSTYHLINRDNINLMKENTIIVNTARGEIIDTEALYDALIENKIKAAALDVLEFEEILSNKPPGDNINFKNLRISLINSKLLKLKNVTATPHIAYDTKEAIQRILDLTILNLKEYLEKKQLKNKVN